MLKTVLYAEKGEGNQAMLIAGSGTLGWDSVGANLIERGDDAVSEAIEDGMAQAMYVICGLWYQGNWLESGGYGRNGRWREFGDPRRLSGGYENERGEAIKGRC
jgi:hypothetical protein